MSSSDWYGAKEASQFEQRKRDHIRLALDPQCQAPGAGFEQIHLIHEAFPEIDFNDVSLSTQLFGQSVSVPLFVSSMTAGHSDSLGLNRVLAKACEQRGWAMGVGSQRRQLDDQAADQEWREIRKSCPKVVFIGNIGLSQLIETKTDAIRRLVDSLEASALFVHTNPLQECLQPEGTPHFKGGLKALERLCKELGVPVIVKEVGCGFSRATLERLKGLGVAAVDVSGMGGTHWGRIEGGRSEPGGKLFETAQTFKNWGIGTVASLVNAMSVKPEYAVWASGGVRSGLDAAICLALGAQMVGLAKPMIEAALQGEQALLTRMEQLEFELKTALFCTGCRNIRELQEKQVWDWATAKA